MIAFSLWWLDVHRYGIFYACAFLAAYLFLHHVWRNKTIEKNYPKVANFFTDHLDNFIIIAVIGVILGWRLGYVFFYERTYYQNNLNEIRAIRQWGMAFVWWLIGVTIWWLIYAWILKLSFKDILLSADSILSIAPFWIMLWRIGNFLNQEIYGIPVPSDARWLPTRITTFTQKTNIFHVYSYVDEVLRVNPSFLASFWEWLLILIITNIIFRKQIKTGDIKPGKVTIIFLILYATIRFFLEYVRVDSQGEFVGIFTISQYFFIAFIIIAIALWFMRKKYDW